MIVTQQIVTAQIVEIAPHPDAKKLGVCQVFDGTQKWQVVCGASNARLNMITIMAQLGSQIPTGLKIEQVNLRGVDSLGMLCSAKELGLSDEGGIIDLPPETKLGVHFTQVDQSILSSIPWWKMKEVESFWQVSPAQIKRVSSDEPRPNGKLISQTFWHDNKYFYKS